jgi:hypothetical protein
VKVCTNQTGKKEKRGVKSKPMNRQELETAAQKAILENQHNLTAPVVVQIWKTRKLCIFPAYPFIEIVIFLFSINLPGN